MPLPEGVTTIAVSRDFRKVLGVAARIRGMTMQQYVDQHLIAYVRADMLTEVTQAATGTTPTT